MLKGRRRCESPSPQTDFVKATPWRPNNQPMRALREEQRTTAKAAADAVATSTAASKTKRIKPQLSRCTARSTALTSERDRKVLS